ncbi:MAG: COX15/CtaA family protein [Pseudomonadota bacterium]
MAKRAIFEEVSTTKVAAPAAPAAEVREWRVAIAAWLWGLAGLVAVMVLVGGLTRLTDSGLSITEWAPVMGAVPPLSDADWQAAFAAYQTTTEFQEQNSWMTLADFKPIFWWEWGHRQLGRLIGLVWFLGFVSFLAARAIPRGWIWRLVLPGALGGVQGAVGWWMVASGLDQLDVASYRLATHLGLAIVILMLLAWFAQKIRLDPVGVLDARRRRPEGLMSISAALVGLVFLQILAGALVAGIDAGEAYAEWPLMGGQLVPPQFWVLEPGWRNLFENAGTVQFVHRVLGYLAVAATVIFVLRARGSGHEVIRGRCIAVGAMMLVQASIGIVTVVLAARLEAAILHQAGAVVLICLMMRARFAIAYPPAQRIARA